jgi:hypothetical protein
MSSSPESFDPYFHWLGIDPAARPVNHYSLLGLPLFENDPARIAAAADDRMRLIRQYQAGPRGAYTQRLLNELARAKICLLNPVSKPAYDQALHQVLYPPPPMPSATAAPPKPKRKLEDIMPPGWDGAAFAPPEAIPPPLPSPPSISAAPRAFIADYDEPRSSKVTPSKPGLTAVVWLGGLIVLVGILGVVFAIRILNPPPNHGPRSRPLVSIPEEPDPDAIDPAHSKPIPPQPVPMVPSSPDEPPAAVVVLQEGSGELNLTPATALVEGKLEREVLGTGEVLVHWSSPADVAEWQFKLVKPGFFELEVQYISHPSLAGKLAKVTWGESTKELKLREPRGETVILRESHIILVKRGGENTLTFRPAEPWPEDAFRLVSIRLIPAVGPQ